MGAVPAPRHPTPYDLRDAAIQPNLGPPEPSADRETAEPLFQTASARATPPQLSTPPHRRFWRAPAGLRSPGPESLCCTRYSTARKEPRTTVCRKKPVATVLGGPRAKSCQYVKGRGFGSERRGQELRVRLRLEEEGPGAQRSERHRLSASDSFGHTRSFQLTAWRWDHKLRLTSKIAEFSRHGSELDAIKKKKKKKKLGRM